MKLVSIITVNYNNVSVTEELLYSIANKNKYENIEIIVVDNGSNISPLPHLTIAFPNVKFIRSEINLGFAGGNNLGIKVAKGDYLFLINNDTEVTESLVGLLANTLDANLNVGVVSPGILFFDQPDVFQYAGFTDMNYITGRNKTIGSFQKNIGQFGGSSVKTAYAHGAAMMVKREAIAKAGLMAENFFLYYEELDWCERIKQKGFEVWVNTEAVIFHKESMSVGKKSILKEYYMNRNRILFMRKYSSIYSYPIFLIYFISIVSISNLIRYLRNRQYTFIPVLLKAIIWNFTNSTSSKSHISSLSK